MSCKTTVDEWNADALDAFSNCSVQLLEKVKYVLKSNVITLKENKAILCLFQVCLLLQTESWNFIEVECFMLISWVKM